MMSFPKLLFVLASCAVLFGCSDPKKPAGGGVAAEPVIQDPVLGTLIEELIKRRGDKDAIYVADCTKKPQSESLTLIKADLRSRKVKFVEPVWTNYQYYLNRVIPMTRRSGRVWLVHDHTNIKLARVLQDGYLDQHKVLFEHKFENATLALVTNEFASDEAQRYSMEQILTKGGTTSNIAFTPDGEYMLVTSKEGTVRWQNRKGDKRGLIVKMPRAKKGIAGVFSGGESGMIGLALHPEFATNHKAYFNYNWRDESGDREARLTEWIVDMSSAPGKITMGSERQLMAVKQVHDNHNAGCLKFGPDGFLYIGIGDGEDGKWTVGRSPAASMRGKVLRIDVNGRDMDKEYAVPADNPFVGDDGFPPETWAWGFRNPWRIVFVPDGRLLASDIGEDVNEEITFVVKGKHHGWPYYEGLNNRNPWTLDVPLQPPLVPYGRKYGMSAIVGNVYEGKLLPELVGKFVFCDYMSGRVWACDLPDTDTTLNIEDCEELTRWPLLLPTITKGVDGELYFGAHTGEVMKLVRADAATQTNASDAATKADPSSARGMFGTEFVGTAGPEATAAQIALGKQLFSDERLSGDGSKSCATCHDFGKFGQDGAVTVAGAKGPARNTPSIFNTHLQFAQFRDYRSFTVEEAVVESLSYHMGNKAVADVVARLGEDKGFADAFPGQEKPVTAANLGVAIGAFVRQLKSPSRWDQFLDGKDSALSDAELVGLSEFLNAGCTTCHMYRGLGGGMPQKLGLQVLWEGPDKGRFLINATPGQEHFFKVPSLYNVVETGPWYHDGSMKTLAEAVKNMATIQLGRELTDRQTESIVTFLKSMTGEKPAIVR